MKILNEAGIMCILIFVLIGCDQGQRMLKPVTDEIIAPEPESQEPLPIVEEPKPLNEEQLEEMYLTLPNFLETFLENEGNMEVDTYRVQLSDFGSRVRIERSAVLESNLSFGYIQLNYEDTKNQYCNPIWVPEDAELVFKLTSHKFEIEVQKGSPATIYHFNIEIVGSRIDFGEGGVVFEKPDGTFANHEWQIPLTPSEVEENCW